MPAQPDPFRDFGILPQQMSPPAHIVRAHFSLLHVIGQYFLTTLAFTAGLAMSVFFALYLSFPINVIALVGALAGSACLVYHVTRNDYAWVELHGKTLRARHLYTRQIVERPIEEIENLLTLTSAVDVAATRLVATWFGRIRGVMIRFHDERTPLLVYRSDPAMKNAKELIEAIIYRMSEYAAVDAEIVDLYGEPFVRRIYWKTQAKLEDSTEPECRA